MFRHPAWTVGSYSSGPATAGTVGTKSTGSLPSRWVTLYIHHVEEMISPPPGSVLHGVVTTAGPVQFFPPCWAGMRIDLVPLTVPGPHWFEQLVYLKSDHTQSTAILLRALMINFSSLLVTLLQDLNVMSFSNTWACWKVLVTIKL